MKNWNGSDYDFDACEIIKRRGKERCKRRKEKDRDFNGRKKSGGKVIKLTKLEWNRVMKGQNNGYIVTHCSLWLESF